MYRLKSSNSLPTSCTTALSRYAFISWDSSPLGHHSPTSHRPPTGLPPLRPALALLLPRRAHVISFYGRLPALLTTLGATLTMSAKTRRTSWTALAHGPIANSSPLDSKNAESSHSNLRSLHYKGNLLGAPVKSDNLDSLQDGFQLASTWEALEPELERRLSWLRMLHGPSLAVRRASYLSLVRSKLP